MSKVRRWWEDDLILNEHHTQGFYWLLGPETFYDKDDKLITFETIDGALEWALSDEPDPLPRESVRRSS